MKTSVEFEFQGYSLYRADLLQVPSVGEIVQLNEVVYRVEQVMWLVWEFSPQPTSAKVALSLGGRRSLL